MDINLCNKAAEDGSEMPLEDKTKTLVKNKIAPKELCTCCMGVANEAYIVISGESRTAIVDPKTHKVLSITSDFDMKYIFLGPFFVMWSGALLSSSKVLGIVGTFVKCTTDLHTLSLADFCDIILDAIRLVMKMPHIHSANQVNSGNRYIIGSLVTVKNENIVRFRDTYLVRLGHVTDQNCEREVLTATSIGYGESLVNGWVKSSWKFVNTVDKAMLKVGKAMIHCTTVNETCGGPIDILGFYIDGDGKVQGKRIFEKHRDLCVELNLPVTDEAKQSNFENVIKERHGINYKGKAIVLRGDVLPWTKDFKL